MESSLSNLDDDLAEGIHEIECKDCDCFLEYESVKDKLIRYVYIAINIIQTMLMKILKSDVITHLNFLTMVSINLFCY